jgi:hypothetical protein
MHHYVPLHAKLHARYMCDYIINYMLFYMSLHTPLHKLALLNLFNRGRQPASWKWCPPHQAGLDLFAHLAYPVEFTYHPLPVIPFPRLNPIYPSLETLLLPPLVLFQCKVV